VTPFDRQVVCGSSNNKEEKDKKKIAFCHMPRGKEHKTPPCLCTRLPGHYARPHTTCLGLCTLATSSPPAAPHALSPHDNISKGMAVEEERNESGGSERRRKKRLSAAACAPLSAYKLVKRTNKEEGAGCPLQARTPTHSHFATLYSLRAQTTTYA